MGNVSIKDVKTLKDEFTSSSKKGFLSFLSTIGQYISIVGLVYMLLNTTIILPMLGGNISTYILLCIAMLMSVYGTSRYNAKVERENIVGEYMKEQQTQLERNKKEHEKLVKHRVNISPKIDNELKDLLIELKADRVCLCEMHNGTNNLSGLPFLYADMAYEVDGHDIEDVSDEFKNVNLSKYPLIGNHFDEGIFLSSVEEIEKEDPKFALRLRCTGSEYFAGMVINGIENPIGILIVTFNKGDVRPSKVEIIAAMNKTSQVISSLMDTSIF